MVDRIKKNTIVISLKFSLSLVAKSVIPYGTQ